MNGGREDNHVGSEETFDQSNWNGCSLIYDQELGLRKLWEVSRVRRDVLNRLAVITVNIYSYNSVIEFWVSTLQDLIVLVLLVVERIKPD